MGRYYDGSGLFLYVLARFKNLGLFSLPNKYKLMPLTKARHQEAPITS